MKTSTARLNLSGITPERRLALYGIAAGAALAGGGASVDASLITLDLTGLSSSSRTTPLNGDLYFDVNAASAANAVSLSSFVGADFRLHNFGTPYASATGLAAGNSIQGFQLEFFKAAHLTTSNFVEPPPTGNFNHYANIAPFDPAWGPNQTGFLGLMFTIGTDTHFGWANITTNPDATLILNALGYESDPNTAAHAEAPSAQGVPDNGNSLVLLAMGAAGLVAFRHRQRQTA